MCEVTNQNFDKLYPEICGYVDSSSFLAVDCEFTALRSADSNLSQNSLFDDAQARYTKLSQPRLHSIISQFGLSIFEQDVTKNTYYARTYNFYISPRSFASVDESFVCQASSLEFLMRYNFDFNKFLYKGIPYLNSEKEERLRKDLKSGIVLNEHGRNIPRQDEDKIRQISSDLAAWITNR